MKFIHDLISMASFIRMDVRDSIKYLVNSLWGVERQTCINANLACLNIEWYFKYNSWNYLTTKISHTISVHCIIDLYNKQHNKGDFPSHI